MKTYDDSVRLRRLSFDLDVSYKKERLNNEEIVKRRWRNTEKALRQALPLIRRVYRQLADEVLSLLKEIDFSYDRINSKVPERVKRIVNDRMDAWKKRGLAKGYLLYMMATHKWTYESVLKLLLTGLYAEKYRELDKISNDVFVIAAVDVYAQSVADRGDPDPIPLSMAAIMALALMPVLQNTYVEYLDATMISQVEEMESFVLVNYMQSIEITDKEIIIRALKQAKRILNIDNDKYSGGLDDAARATGNAAYTENTEEEPDLQVRFIAEMDEKTTPMCRSLDGQIFNVHKQNTFTRYSAMAGNEIEVTCRGLVAGLNMPPISDHFHWCRSTLTYQI